MLPKPVAKSRTNALGPLSVPGGPVIVDEGPPAGEHISLGLGSTRHNQERPLHARQKRVGLPVCEYALIGFALRR